MIFQYGNLERLAGDILYHMFLLELRIPEMVGCIPADIGRCHNFLGMGLLQLLADHMPGWRQPRYLQSHNIVHLVARMLAGIEIRCHRRLAAVHQTVAFHSLCQLRSVGLQKQSVPSAVEIGEFENRNSELLLRINESCLYSNF